MAEIIDQNSALAPDQIDAAREGRGNNASLAVVMATVLAVVASIHSKIDDIQGMLQGAQGGNIAMTHFPRSMANSTPQNRRTKQSYAFNALDPLQMIKQWPLTQQRHSTMGALETLPKEK